MPGAGAGREGTGGAGTSLPSGAGATRHPGGNFRWRTGGYRRPTVSTGRLGSDPRTEALCTENGDTWDVAAAPDGGFYVIGTCADVPRLWLVR